MGLDRLGSVLLDPARVTPELSSWSPAKAIQHDWTIAYAGFASMLPRLPEGSALRALLAANR